MQIKKNHAVQGNVTPSSVGSGALGVVATGSMLPKRGHVAYTGKIEVLDASCPVLHAVIRVQSTETRAVVDPRKEMTFVVGHAKFSVWVDESVHLVVTVIAGVANANPVSTGQVTVNGTIEGGNVTVVTMAEGAVMVEVMAV
jgi:hypothetical protein